MLAAVAVAVFVGTLIAQGSRGLFESTEGRYGRVAQEMLESGNFMVPTLGGNPHWTKPPLTYWAMAGGMALLGQNAWGVRLGGAMAAAVMATLLAALAGAIWDRPTALLASLVWATGLLPAAGAHVASTDIYLAAAETAAVAAFLLGWLHQRRAGFVVMWACFGLAFLIKGPPGLLPLLPIVVFGWKTGLLGRLFPPAGLLLFGAFGLSWYVLVIMGTPDLLDYFIGVEVVDRIASRRVHHSEWHAALTLYAPVVTASLGAWGLLAAWHAYRSPWRQRLAAAWRHNSPTLFLLLWVLLPLAVFCAVRSKLPLYLLPLTAPLALLAARQLRLAVPMRTLGWIGLASALLVVGAKVGLAHVENHNNMRQLASHVQPLLEHAPAPPEVAAFRQTKLFGLEFYLRTRIHRIADIPLTSDYPVEVFPLAAFLGRRHQPLVLVVDRRDRDFLEAALAAAGWTYTENSGTRRWSIGHLAPGQRPDRP